MRERTCLTADCGRPAECRGLCDAHYLRWFKLISKGLTTWKKLVAEGYALARDPRGQPTPARKEG